MAKRNVKKAKKQSKKSVNKGKKAKASSNRAKPVHIEYVTFKLKSGARKVNLDATIVSNNGTHVTLFHDASIAQFSDKKQASLRKQLDRKIMNYLNVKNVKDLH